MLHEVHGCPQLHYLKLKMSGLGGVITIGTSFQRAYECEVKCCDHATAIIASEELVAIRKEVTEEVPDPKRSTGSFELAEGSKEVLIFEVVDFLGSYHAILGWPCYTKFMAIPNYTYLKLKMPGPNGVIHEQRLLTSLHVRP